MEKQQNTKAAALDIPAKVDETISEMVLNFVLRILSLQAVIPSIFLMRSHYGERFLSFSVAFFSTLSVWAVASVAGGANAFSRSTFLNNARPTFGAPEDAPSTVAGIGIPFLVAAIYTVLVAARYSGVLKRWLEDRMYYPHHVHSFGDGTENRLFAAVKYRFRRVLQGHVLFTLEVGAFFVGGIAVASLAGSLMLQLAVIFWTLMYMAHQRLILSVRRDLELDEADARNAMEHRRRIDSGEIKEERLPTHQRNAVDRQARQAASLSAFADARARVDAQADAASAGAPQTPRQSGERLVPSAARDEGDPSSSKLG